MSLSTSLLSDVWISHRAPRAYKPTIMSLGRPERAFRFGTGSGSKVPLRSRGTAISAYPAVVMAALVVKLLRESPLPWPLKHPTRHRRRCRPPPKSPRCSSAPTATPMDKLEPGLPDTARQPAPS
jgi:hypothetical protein